MHISTSAIVLRLTRHSDKACIAHLYTHDYGRMQYLVYGLDSKKKRAQRALLEPLMEIEIEAVHKEGHALQQLGEFRLLTLPTQLQTDISRRCVAMFIAEVVASTLLHPLQEQVIYSFLKETVTELDSCADPENVHLRFLLGFAEILGFGIDLEQKEYAPLAVIYSLSASNRIIRADRQLLLRILLNYYEKHIPDFHAPKSLPILQELFD